jgi:hypothetical protein
MIPHTRRAAVLVAFSLLASAATAHAECSWVLWQHQGISPIGAPVQQWLLQPVEATSNEQECRKLLARIDGALGPQDVNGYSYVNDSASGKQTRVRNFCLPDTVDPRGPKGK